MGLIPFCPGPLRRIRARVPGWDRDSMGWLAVRTGSISRRRRDTPCTRVSLRPPVRIYIFVCVVGWVVYRIDFGISYNQYVSSCITDVKELNILRSEGILFC